MKRKVGKEKKHFKYSWHWNTLFCICCQSGLPTAVETALALLLTTRCATLRSVLDLTRTSVLSSASREATNTTKTSSTPGCHTSIQMVSLWRLPLGYTGLDCDVMVPLYTDAVSNNSQCVYWFPFKTDASVSWAASRRKRERWFSWTKWCMMGHAAATLTPSVYVPEESVWYVLTEASLATELFELRLPSCCN